MSMPGTLAGSENGGDFERSRQAVGEQIFRDSSRQEW